MTITDVRIRRIFFDGNLRAIASITLDEAFAVHDLKVVDNGQRLFVAMPSRQYGGGQYHDVVHPITPEFRKELEEQVIAAYQAVSSKAK